MQPFIPIDDFYDLLKQFNARLLVPRRRCHLSSPASNSVSVLDAVRLPHAFWRETPVEHRVGTITTIAVLLSSRGANGPVNGPLLTPVGAWTLVSAVISRQTRVFLTSCAVLLDT